MMEDSLADTAGVTDPGFQRVGGDLTQRWLPVVVRERAVPDVELADVHPAVADRQPVRRPPGRRPGQRLGVMEEADGVEGRAEQEHDAA